MLTLPNPLTPELAELLAQAASPSAGQAVYAGMVTLPRLPVSPHQFVPIDVPPRPFPRPGWRPVTPDPVAYRSCLPQWPFDLPFAPRLPSRDCEVVEAHCRQWVQEKGLVQNEAALRRHERNNMASWACMNYPDASVPDLELVGDWVCWWAIWNDMLDDEEFSRNRVAVRAFFDRLIAVVLCSPAPSDGDDPHPDAFADIWQRWRKGMSPLWKARTAANWVDWFNAFPVAVEARERTLTIEEYLKIRDVTGGMLLEMDALERVGNFEIPPAVLETPAMRRMRLISCRVVNLTQDVQSLAKEEAAGESNNMVLVVERDLDLSRDEALVYVHRDVRRYTDAFLEEESTVPDLLDHLRMPVEERSPIYRYIAGMRTLMISDVEWCAASGRYR